MEKIPVFLFFTITSTILTSTFFLFRFQGKSRVWEREKQIAPPSSQLHGLYSYQTQLSTKKKRLHIVRTEKAFFGFFLLHYVM